METPITLTAETLLMVNALNALLEPFSIKMEFVNLLILNVKLGMNKMVFVLLAIMDITLKMELVLKHQLIQLFLIKDAELLKMEFVLSAH